MQKKVTQKPSFPPSSVIMEANHGIPEVTTVAGGGAAATPPGTCRWNPTKEQINMLENLYRQGIRTPSAEQIQEITTRLQAYGHIEGKNVFYWFQNHKARQRQKQKQDHLSFFHQYLHHHHHHHQPAVFPLPPPPNVVCGPCYVPQSDLGLYAQYPKVLIPTTSCIRRRSPRGAARLKPPQPIVANVNMINKPADQIANAANGRSHQETLDLFPLHPTGILQEKGGGAATSDASPLASTTCTSSCSDGSGDQIYFDFFSGTSHA